MTARPRVDPLPCWPLERRDEHARLRHPDRCRHDMLPRQCSWCRGLPDLPNLDAWTEEPPAQRLQWRAAEQAEECLACGGEIPKREPVAFSAAHQGLIGRCCGEAA